MSLENIKAGDILCSGIYGARIKVAAHIDDIIFYYSHEGKRTGLDRFDELEFNTLTIKKLRFLGFKLCQEDKQ